MSENHSSIMSSSNEEISGLSSRLELEFILTQLRKIRSDITSEEVPNPSSMSSSKKYKISGLNGLELDLALAQLPKLSSSIVIEEMESDPTPTDTSFIGQLDNLIATLNSRANISLVHIAIIFSPCLQYLTSCSHLLSPFLVIMFWKGLTSCERAYSASIHSPHLMMQLSPLGPLALTNHGQMITCTSTLPSLPTVSSIEFVVIPLC